MKVRIIGVPMDLGQDRRGVDMGPSAIRNAYLSRRLEENDIQVEDAGNIEVPNPETLQVKNKKLKYIDEILNVSEKTADKVYKAISDDRIPLVLGGDHSIALGSVTGTSKALQKIGLIWIDAHGDINTDDTTPSGNPHGMPLGAALGYGNEALVNIYFDGPKVKPENTFIIGVRDLDEGEIELANRIDLNLYTMETIRSRGLDSIIKEITTKIINSNIDAIHLSFDIDVLDKKLVPGTGTPVDGGFTIEEVKGFFKSFLETKLIRSMDFVELNPLLDKNDSTADICIELIDWIFTYM